MVDGVGLDDGGTGKGMVDTAVVAVGNVFWRFCSPLRSRKTRFCVLLPNLMFVE